MNLLNLIKEVGVLEVERVSAMFPERAADTITYIPYIDTEFIEKRIHLLADSIIDLRKNTILLLTPEIALIEALIKNKWNGTIIIALPSDFDNESNNRVQSNTPIGAHVKYIVEGAFPTDFRPKDSAIICAGLTPTGYRYYIPLSCYRMMMLYRIFHGERILLSCSSVSSYIPELGWTYAEDDFFTDILPA